MAERRKGVVSGLGADSGGGKKGHMYIESREVAVWKKKIGSYIERLIFSS